MVDVRRRTRKDPVLRRISDSEFLTEYPGNGDSRASTPDSISCISFDKAARRASYMTSLTHMSEAKPHTPEEVEMADPSGLEAIPESVSREGTAAESSPDSTGKKRQPARTATVHPEPGGLERQHTIHSIHNVDSSGSINEGFDGTIRSLGGRDTVVDEDKTPRENIQIQAETQDQLTAAVGLDKHVQFLSDNTDKQEIIVAYWRQIAQGAVTHKKAPSKDEIKEYLDEILMNAEVENKDKLQEEVYYILNHFRQRRCRHFCKREDSFIDKTRRGLRKVGTFVSQFKDYCECGVDKDNHTEDAIKDTVEVWNALQSTEIVYPWCFGDLEIPGTYNYLETPGGSRKYIRLDDLKTEPRHLWELFTRYWNFKSPKMVISFTGGDVRDLQGKPRLYKKFRDGLMRIAVRTKSWILTEGLHDGVAKEVGDIFQEDLKRSEYAELEDHSNIPLIAFCPWGILADKSQLLGIHVGTSDATYSQHTVDRLNPASGLPNALDPFHVAYVLTDDGTAGQYKNESLLRRRFEQFIHRKTNLSILGASDVKTPLVILVVDGDIFTLEKVNDALANKIPVVIVHGSGGRADLIVNSFRSLEHVYPRAHSGIVGWEEQEEQHFESFINSHNTNALTEDPLNENEQSCLKGIMKSRYLIEVFGVEAGDETNLDKAILKAIFDAVHDLSAQLYLTMALDRPDIAKETIFIESRKHELKGRTNLLEQALLLGRAEFVDLLLDHDIGGELNDFDKFLTVERLHRLHAQNLDSNHIMGKLLRSFCKRNHYGDYVLGGAHLLPQVGRVIHKLMGPHYRLLYQEKAYRDAHGGSIPHKMSNDRTEEAVWHLFLWAVLAGKRDIAELFLFETSSKIGAALIAFKMFREMSVAAEGLSEVELQEDLMASAKYFENLAECTLDHLYEFNRDEAYTCLVSTLPFRWGRYITPLSVGEDAGAMTFMGHACCQTFLNRVWMHYMDTDTEKWKLFPLFAFFPFLNIPFIVFDKRNLAFGHYRQLLKDDADFNPDVDTKLADENGLKNRIRTGSGRKSSTRERRTSGGAPDTDVEISDSDSDESEKSSQKKKKRGNILKRLKFAFWCTRMYYTAPVNKFLLNFVSYLVFLGIFSHFLLTELAPIDTISDITGYEWFVMVYVFSITVEETIQLFGRKCSGPLWNISWQELEPEWKRTWSFWERFSFVLHIHKITLWLSDRWNSIDAIMLLLYYISVILRFSVTPTDFGLVRTFYSVSLIIFYFRILRIGYILKDIGPRIVTIRHMMKDLLQFILILAVFIISFGIAFQALLDPNKPSSWSLFVDILWRPYWQMYGEMYLDDTMGEMGRAVQVERNCTYSRAEAAANPGLPVCYSWMIPILLGVYMLITNILLLNLLIAIFSHSFEIIETESQTVWRFHMYDLVHEYYHQPWLPAPFNILCHLANLVFYLLTWPQRWCFHYRKGKHMKAIRKKSPHSILFAAESQQGYNVGYLEHQAEEVMKKENCYCCWTKELVMSSKQEINNHFLQQEFMRNEDLEEKAYKRYLRSQKKDWQQKVTKHLENSNFRLEQLASDVQDLKKVGANPQAAAAMSRNRSDSQDRPTSFSGEDSGQVVQRQIRDMTVPLVRRMDHLDRKVDGLYDRLDSLTRDLGTISEYLRERKDKKRRTDSKLSLKQVPDGYEAEPDEETRIRKPNSDLIKRKR